MFDDKTIEANHARMVSVRSGIDATRAELAELVLPSQGNHFNGTTVSVGAPQGDAQMDEYGAQALQDGVSAAEGFVMPRGQKWQGFKVGDDALMDSVEVAQWFETIANRVFAMRNDPKSGFVNATHAGWESLLAFGEQSMWVDKRFDVSGRFVGLSYQSEHIAQIFVELDADGNTLRVHRVFTLTAEQALAKWREKAPPMVREAMKPERPRPDERFEFIHVIERNTDLQPGRLDAVGKAWKACYYSRRDRQVFEIGGYRTLRRIVSRWSRSPGESHGRGPAEGVLKALRATQIIAQDEVIAVEIAAKGRWLAPDDELDSSIIALGADGITFGGLDERGNPRLQALNGGGDIGGADAILNRLYERIGRAFYTHLMQINRELKTHITEARTLEEIGEKGILLGPLARQEMEWFAPLGEVELDLLWDEGFLDDMPPALAEYFSAGGGFSAIYDNNLTRMMEAFEAAGYLRTAGQVASIAQFDPGAVAAFTREYPLDKVIPGLGRANGVPARWRATDDEKRAQDEAEQAQAAAQEFLAAAPVLAGAAKDAAAAGASGGI